jgi:hypothetical protein
LPRQSGEKSKEKACCVQLATDYLNRTGEFFKNLLAHNTFNEYTKVSKQICQKFVQEKQFRQKQFRRYQMWIQSRIKMFRIGGVFVARRIKGAQSMYER